MFSEHIKHSQVLRNRFEKVAYSKRKVTRVQGLRTIYLDVPNQQYKDHKLISRQRRIFPRGHVTDRMFRNFSGW